MKSPSAISDTISGSLLILLPTALIIVQPDLGSALVILAIGAGMVLIRGIPTWHFILLICLMAIVIPLGVWPNLENYQRERITIFWNPEKDPQDQGYQIIQSRIAIGSGGLWGKGYRQGTQSQLGFIPYHYADFIYAVLAEEGGFVAAAGLLLLYALLFWRLVAMAIECPKERDQLIIAGVLSFISFQMIVNIGVTLGLAPVTGITLPLVSYGGTSLLSTLLSLTLAYVAHRDRYSDW
ncbi:MAG: FtsW/RodA/SpoVE family cell cycle protein [Deinococcales bacterium]